MKCTSLRASCVIEETWCGSRARSWERSLCLPLANRTFPWMSRLRHSLFDCSRRSSVEAPAWSKSKGITQQRLQADIHENAALQVLGEKKKKRKSYCPANPLGIAFLPVTATLTDSNRLPIWPRMPAHLGTSLQTVEAQTIQTSSNMNAQLYHLNMSIQKLTLLPRQCEMTMNFSSVRPWMLAVLVWDLTCTASTC